MSSYRDDMNDTAIAGDSTWMQLRSIVESTARATETVLFSLLVLHTGSAVASDLVQDHARMVVQESAQVSDEVAGLLRANILIQAGATAKDRVLHKAIMVTVDTAQASDQLLYSTRSAVVEQAGISENWINTRRVSDLATERARAFDGIVSLARSMVQDDAQASDWAGGRGRYAVLLQDGASAGDKLLGSHTIRAPMLVETAIASSDVLGLLLARDGVLDVAVAADEPVQFGDFGQAWTTNSGNWAMSRYAPFTFKSLAVINGVLYGCNAQGVFALDGQTDEVNAEIRTGPLDLTGGQHCHLISAHMEYTLTGTSTMTVTGTQSGSAEQSYSYPLPAEPAQVLTNGRFQFGRGFRGRHFAFTLKLNGQQAYINDLSILVAPSKRSI